MSRITLPGSLFIAFIVIMPALAGLLDVQQAFSQFFGGTSLLILVGVVIDTLQQIESHLLMRHYDGLWIQAIPVRVVLLHINLFLWNEKFLKTEDEIILSSVFLYISKADLNLLYYVRRLSIWIGYPYPLGEPFPANMSSNHFFIRYWWHKVARKDKAKFYLHS